MARGRLRIYLGAAPGVGKTYAMLDEGYRRRQRGTDVVVAFVETHGRARTEEQIRDLEVVPRRTIGYRDAYFHEMDVDAVLARHPDVALVDELAHTNVPGSRHAKRWEDVEALLEAGIDVISTVNVQHLESVNDVVEQITGIRQHETVPDEVVRSADQIELVDMTPEALRRRMAHGNIYAADKIDAALANYFRPGNLSALRELALLWTADRVDEALEEYRVAQGIEQPWETRERVVVAVTGAPSGEHLIRRAARIAQRARGELVGVHVRADDGLVAAPSELLERHRRLVADLGGEYHEAVGTDVADALVTFARAENATQLVLGASHRSRTNELVRGSVINEVIRRAGAIDVHVISDTDQQEGPRPLPRRRLPVISRRRRALGAAIAVVGLPLLTALLVLLEDTAQLSLATEVLAFLLLVVVVGLVGGLLPAVAAAVVASVLLNWYLTEPRHTLTIAEPENALGLAAFVAVAVVVSVLVDQIARRSLEASRARAEAEVIARVAGGLLGHDDPQAALVELVRTTFGLEAVAILRQDEGLWVVEAAAGSPVPAEPGQLDRVELSTGGLLVVVGPALRADDRRVLRTFVAQLDLAREQRRLRDEAAVAEAERIGDRLRTALLRAVSHDLRTPLASIKASVTSLQQHDVVWSEADRESFLATIDQEADRLDRLVANLLDMSRLESGAVDPLLRLTDVGEVVASALGSIGGELAASVAHVEVDVPPDLPPVVADPQLLERVVANLVANAMRFAPEGRPVRVDAGQVGARVDLRILDHGPGITPARRERLFDPFLGDGEGGAPAGVGLGLAVARGFADAMGARLDAEDTPGGGLTMVVSLEMAVPSDD